ncbi:YdeI/OmpD-associated family protein [Lunatibacter salilacus]|uniref:YdeI/OmpD-associated family protein n=1 Tax=Lunatibacter salilacus TaxID=2483804 RepID=UPI0037420EB1
MAISAHVVIFKHYLPNWTLHNIKPSRDHQKSPQNKTLGAQIYFELSEDPNPLGVDIPEVLEVLLEQDLKLKTVFESLTFGKKRSVIFSINKTKDIYKQIQKSIQIINDSTKPRPKGKL